MTSATGSTTAPLDVATNGGTPSTWRELRNDDDIQFEPVQMPEVEPREPGWFEELLEAIGDFFSSLFGPLLIQSWPILRWVLVAILIAAVVYIIWRMLAPLSDLKRQSNAEETEVEWQPDREETIALLEDADRLASEGRYDEATHLLLKRSVSQIASARPDWVSPSSTARELSRLPELSDGARGAFGTIAERVERSLFALRSLDRDDWEAARAAYAEFALAKIDSGKRRRSVIDGSAMPGAAA